MKKILCLIFFAVAISGFSQPIIRHILTTNTPAETTNAVRAIMADSLTNNDTRNIQFMGTFLRTNPASGNYISLTDGQIAVGNTNQAMVAYFSQISTGLTLKANAGTVTISTNGGIYTPGSFSGAGLVLSGTASIGAGITLTGFQGTRSNAALYVDADSKLTGLAGVGDGAFLGTASGVPGWSYNGSGLTNLAASNIVSGGVLPQGTVAANNGTNGNVLMFDGTSRVWSNAPSLAAIYGTGTPGLTINSNASSTNIALVVNGGVVINQVTNTYPLQIVTTGYGMNDGLIITNTTAAGKKVAQLGHTSQNFGALWLGALSGAAASANYTLQSDGSANVSLNAANTVNGTHQLLFGNSVTYATSITTNAFTIKSGSGLFVASAVTVTNGLQLPYTNAPIKFINVGATNALSASATTAYIFAGTNGGGGTDNSSEVYILDGAGNYTLISPHAQDSPFGLDDNSGAALDYIIRHHNVYLGAAEWINISRLARRMEQVENVLQILIQQTSTNGLNGLQLARLNQFASLSAAEKNIIAVRTNFAPAKSWSTVQNQEQTAYATGYTNAVTAYNAALQAGDTNAVAPIWTPPPLYPVPTRLSARGVQ